MNFKVVSTCNIPFVVNGLSERIKGLEGVEFIDKPAHTEDDIILATSDADAVVVGIEPYTRRVINSLKLCRLLTTPKMGYDNIDVSTATEAGIVVSCVPNACIEEVSDHTMALILACARKVIKLDATVRAGGWRKFHGPEMEDIWHGILPLRGQTLGIIGFGRIGRALVPKAKGFGLGILAYDPCVPAKVMKEMGVTSTGLHRLLKESDYVSLHCALTDENKHMLGLEQFKLMKKTAYLINSARGTLLDEEALYKALTMGYMAGAGLDALEVEPVNMDNPLLKLENVIFTGHSAHYSDIAIDNIRQSPVDAIANIISGKWPVGWVNPQVEATFIARWGKPK